MTQLTQESQDEIEKGFENTQKFTVVFGEISTKINEVHNLVESNASSASDVNHNIQILNQDLSEASQQIEAHLANVAESNLSDLRGQVDLFYEKAVKMSEWLGLKAEVVDISDDLAKGEQLLEAGEPQSDDDKDFFEGLNSGEDKMTG